MSGEKKWDVSVGPSDAKEAVGCLLWMLVIVAIPFALAAFKWGWHLMETTP